VSQVVPWLGHLLVVAGLSSRMPGFDPDPVCRRFVMDSVTFGRVFLGVLKFYLIGIIPPVPHTHLHLSALLVRKDKRSKRGHLQSKQCSFGYWGGPWTEEYSYCLRNLQLTLAIICAGESLPFLICKQ
jgi:hypothetical protein